MACNCGKKSCNGSCSCDHSEFVAPMGVLNEIYDGIDSKSNAQLVSIAWEREEGKIYRYDFPIPKRYDAEGKQLIQLAVERIAKFIV